MVAGKPNVLVGCAISSYSSILLAAWLKSCVASGSSAVEIASSLILYESSFWSRVTDNLIPGYNGQALDHDSWALTRALFPWIVLSSPAGYEYRSCLWWSLKTICPATNHSGASSFYLPAILDNLQDRPSLTLRFTPLNISAWSNRSKHLLKSMSTTWYSP